MAEVASGAVSALLGVIRNEALLLGGVEGDVQFIKEEMESMNSFLLHLARTGPPSREHDEQVRTWMNQVRLLAQDCNNCIDLYLKRGNPDIHLAKAGFWRYLMWAPWFLRKTIAQRRAATRLRDLKERARDVGERRMRYGVEVPAAVSGQSPPSGATATLSTHVADEGAGDDEHDGGDHLVVATVTDHSGPRAFEPYSWEDYFERKLLEWMDDITWVPIYSPSIAIVALDTHQEDEVCALAREVLDVKQMHHVLVDIPAVHHDFLPLRPKEILYYILRELELEHARSQSQAKQQEATSSGQDEGEEQQPLSKWRAERKRKDDIYSEQRKFFSEISDNIQQMKPYDKLENVKSEILKVKGDQLQPYLGQVKDDSLEPTISKEPLGALLLLLKSAATEQDQVGKKKAKPTVAAFYDYEDFIEATTLKLKEHMEAGAKQPPPICLSSAKYEQILREMFPKTSDSNAQEQDKKITTTTLHEDHIKEIAGKVKQEILREVFPILMTGNSKALQDQDHEQGSSAAKHATITTLGEVPIKGISIVDKQETIQGVKEDKRHKKRAIGKQDGHGKIPDSMVLETTEKIDNIKARIKAQMKIKGIVDKIGEYLEDDMMIILKIDEMMNGYLWEETRKALNLLDYMASALIITTRSTHRAKEYCCEQWEPIDCSLVGLYHATVLKLTSQKMQQDNYNPQLFRHILDQCEPHEFCMKIFAHALYANPKRSNEELSKLNSTLQVSSTSLGSIAKKMIKFSYNDLPKEYKSCFLYLAIFPQGHKIRRSTLIARWVVEGLITTEDWSWPSSVDKAERCFEMLINRWLIYPADIGVTGDVKSCMVDDLVHEFITTIAKKQRIMQLRLSHHLARHFSISNDLRLRGSDTIHSFLKKLSESSQFSLLKVIDLENCMCFSGKNKHYLKDICCKILLLKYLSLRGTDVTHLPKEINYLHELEVLDIRHTKVPEYETRNVRLMKLKHLLAGHINPSPRNTYTGTAFSVKECPSSVQVPDKIEKMQDMEVLSNVTAPSNQALKDIGALCQLRKLGVVIEEKDTRLQNLLVAISNMHECLQSLSITIRSIIGHSDAPSSRRTPSSANNVYSLSYPPKVLKSLSINGTTQKVQLLQKLLEKGADQLVKVTLRSTWLNQVDLNVLADLPKLLCMRLGDKAYTESELIFKNNEFNHLKFFHVEGSNMTEISFEDGAAPELEKIILSFTNDLKSVSGVEGLLKLKELELKNNNLLPLFDKANQIAKVTLLGTFLKQGDLQILARKPNMQCLVLLDNSYVEPHLIFNKDEFPKLNLLTIDSSHITNISFNCGSTPKLKKIIWSLTKDTVVTLSGIDNLPRLKEFELNGEFVPNEVQEAIKRHRNKPILKHNKPKKKE